MCFYFRVVIQVPLKNKTNKLQVVLVVLTNVTNVTKTALTVSDLYDMIIRALQHLLIYL